MNLLVTAHLGTTAQGMQRHKNHSMLIKVVACVVPGNTVQKVPLYLYRALLDGTVIRLSFLRRLTSVMKDSIVLVAAVKQILMEAIRQVCELLAE